MKKTITTIGCTLLFIAGIYAQDKKEMKELEKQYMAFTDHKQFYKNKEWAMCKFSIVYKLSTAMTAKDVAKNKECELRVDY